MSQDDIGSSVWLIDYFEFLNWFLRRRESERCQLPCMTLCIDKSVTSSEIGIDQMLLRRA